MTDFDWSPDPNMGQSPDPALEESSQACLAPEKPSQASSSASPLYEPEATPAVNAGRTESRVTLPEAIRAAQRIGVDGFTSPGHADRLLRPDELIATVEWVHAEYDSDLPAVYTVGTNGAVVNATTGQTEYAPGEVRYDGGTSLAPPEPSASPPASAVHAAAPSEPALSPSDNGEAWWHDTPNEFGVTTAQNEAFAESFSEFRQTVDNAVDNGVFGFADRVFGTYVETERALETSSGLTHGLLQVKRAGQIITVGAGSAVGHFVVNIPMGIAQLVTDPVGVADGMVQAHAEVLRGPQEPGWDYAAKTLEVVSTDALLLLTGARIAGVKGPVISRGAPRTPLPPPTPKTPPPADPAPPPPRNSLGGEVVQMSDHRPTRSAPSSRRSHSIDFSFWGVPRKSPAPAPTEPPPPLSPRVAPHRRTPGPEYERLPKPQKNLEHSAGPAVENEGPLSPLDPELDPPPESGIRRKVTLPPPKDE